MSVIQNNKCLVISAAIAFAVWLFISGWVSYIHQSLALPSSMADAWGAGSLFLLIFLSCRTVKAFGDIDNENTWLILTDGKVDEEGPENIDEALALSTPRSRHAFREKTLFNVKAVKQLSKALIANFAVISVLALIGPQFEHPAAWVAVFMAAAYTAAAISLIIFYTAHDFKPQDTIARIDAYGASEAAKADTAA